MTESADLLPDATPHSPANQPARLSEARARELLARSWMKVQPSLMAFIVASTPQFSDAEDLLQEVAAEVALRFDDYDPAKPFLPWALWVAKIKIADYYRGKQRHPLTFLGDSIDALAEACTRVQGTLAEEKWALEKCLSHLTKRSRQLLHLRYFEDLTPQEISTQLGMSAGSVRVSLSRVRSSLTSCVQSAMTGNSVPHE